MSAENPGDIARISSQLTVFFGFCKGHHQADEKSFQELHRELMKRGEAAGGESFVEMLSTELSRRAREFRADGAEFWCSRMQERIRKTPYNKVFKA